MTMESKLEGFLREVLWANIYHDTVIGSDWFTDRAVSPGGPERWAVGYNFLYALYRVLNEMHPKTILELGLGQTTNMTKQYARHFGADHTVVEHDKDWVDFFCRGWGAFRQTNICVSPIYDTELEGQVYYAYQNFSEIVKPLKPCELIIVDGPFGDRSERSRRDIVPHLPELLAEEFVIMIDDCGRIGEQNLINEIRKILADNNIDSYFGLYKSGEDCHVGVIACKKWRFFTSL